jgi:hypothetical protein
MHGEVLATKRRKRKLGGEKDKIAKEEKTKDKKNIKQSR